MATHRNSCSYIYDTANEVKNRFCALHPDERSSESLDPKIAERLVKMLDDHNPLARQFRLARDRLAENGDEEFIYPLLFPYSERGFQVGVPYSGVDTSGENKRAKVTMQDYYRHCFHYRKGQSNPFLCYGALSTQAKVDARACIDENRLWYVLRNQGKLRVETLQGIVDAVDKGCVDGGEIGKKKLCCRPPILVAGVHGPPDFFVTFTCNPKWPEIAAALSFEPGQKSTDRADIVVRVYNMKLEELLGDIRDGTAFGPVSAVLHTVDFQKRGLPHALIIVWLKQDTSHPTPAFIDKFISAEVPDPHTDPLGYVLVAEHLVHGPCGASHPTCPCMKKDKCSKWFPKKYQTETVIDDNGFALYRRSDNRRYVEKGGKRLDSSSIVPYNMTLLKKYQAHINVEWCNKGIFIKYLFKYVTKGPDRGKFVANQQSDAGRDLTYCEFPSRWKWDSSSRFWDQRRRGSGKIGRLYYVHPSVGERYFLRMLLLVVKGARSFEEVRTYNGVVYSTFRLACNARGLLGDDQEWYSAFDEAAAWATSPQLRKLFVTMLLFCEVKDERAFFEKVWKVLADDIQYRLRDNMGNPEFHVCDEDLRNYLLDDIHALFQRNGAKMREHALPEKIKNFEDIPGNRLIEEALSYDSHQAMRDAENLILSRTTNMRLNRQDLDSELQKEIAEFSKWVLDIGEGKIESLGTSSETQGTRIKIPRELLLMPQEDKAAFMVSSIYPDLGAKYADAYYLQARAILTPTNEAADTINSYVVSLIPGEEKEYLSCDRIAKSPDTHDSFNLLYPTEFLNSINGNNFPQHASVKKKKKLRPMAFSMLPALRPNDWRAVICVRVCRKWEYRGGTDDGPVQHVDLVLLDEQGNSLYGEIPGPEVHAKSPLIDEGGIYVIDRFRVSNAKVLALFYFFCGSYYLSGNTSCRWYFNPTIPEAHQFYASFHNQRLEIRSVAAPVQQQIQVRVPAQLDEKNLKQLNDMNPYEFSQNRYRCTVTIGRLVPNTSWWFPSCNKCNKSCVPDGTGYRCIPCSNTSFKFKYKVCFIALDGTDEAKMVCFGDIARRMIGKPVQQLLRTSTSANAYPPDITKLVSLRFTFVVTMTRQSYYRAQKTYNVASLVTAHGHPVAVPTNAARGNAGNKDHGHLGATESGDSSGTSDGADTHQLLSAGTPDGTLSSPGPLNAPPPKLDGLETPASKKHSRSGPSKSSNHPSSRRRLFKEGTGADIADPDGAGARPRQGGKAGKREGKVKRVVCEGSIKPCEDRERLLIGPCVESIKEINLSDIEILNRVIESSGECRIDLAIILVRSAADEVEITQ
ncbi:unnamed protein product [Miscanthus lutarioriparius]|uniref:ATP-dependent DNA helicase n=1 Tax=Miscanthus lutarioriparius TaxID=422564 RepID=A0A811QLU9_9POAL|nr:unnamed protein product [Miscanthus lutarioriparius]